MLARWFDRDGIGQYIAPDENAPKQRLQEEAKSSIWQFIAPDPRFAEKKAPPLNAFAMITDHPNQVQCVSCGHWMDIPDKIDPPKRVQTPAKIPETTTETPPNEFTTPKPSYRTPGNAIKEEINNLILSAAKDTAASMNSPPHVREQRDKVFRLCGSAKPINDLAAKRLRKILMKNPALVSSRATNLGLQAPDGFTPLMVTAYANHVVAAEIVLQAAPKTCIWERDMQGRTALHIAAEHGHMEMINLLLPKFQRENGITSPAPLDILGRTPFGRAVTSPNPTAKKRRKELESALFLPGDLSVLGDIIPESERGGQCPELQVAYGLADMPGMRVTMEDAVCAQAWQQGGKSYCLLAVCDGHGDRGCVSKFVADNLPNVLKPFLDDMGSTWEEKFQNACLKMDSKLKEESIRGGSTAVIALVTESEVVIANVGDSRAILIQSSGSKKSNLESKMEKLSVEDSKEAEVPPSEDGNEKISELPKSENTVIALSDDHKPNLSGEQARIENAGMNVKAVTFEEDGKEVTIHKVILSDRDELAVSRAFGDFEYKGNKTLSPKEQAVVAVADVRVHTRDSDRDMYLVLACDGVFDVLDNKQVMDFILHQVSVRKEITDTVLPEVGDALLRESLNAGSKDNMTVVLAALSKASAEIKAIIQGRALDFA